MNFRKWSGFIVFLGSLYILWQLREFLLLLLTAVILANALNVLVVKLQNLSTALAKKFKQPRLCLGRPYAVVVSLLLVGFTIWLAFTIVVPPFIEQVQLLFEKLNSGLYQLDDWVEVRLVQIEQNLNVEISQQIPDLSGLIDQIPTLFNELLSRGWTFFSDTLKVLLNLLLLLVLTLMFLADPQPYRRGFIRLFPSFYRRRIDEILTLCAVDLRGWVAGIMFNMLCIGICSFLGLSLLGLSLALPQAILAGLLTFIPNIGPALSVIPPIMIALLEEPWKVWAVIILYFGIQQIEGNLLTPLVMSRQVSLLPAITLLAQVLFAVSLQLGFLGLFLALPLTVIAQVLVREILVKDILDPWQEIHDLPPQNTSVVMETAYVVTESETPVETAESNRPQPGETLPPSDT
ncbi:AI-2E family transporter [[Limnothrix rosea] IAM M-220]|uniref:AI-2E family transporter n=1 Tax=[Limnothrix rosea] IAM M-220 TaxID=454133 RepID=UPI000966FD70|nr:AI-2E family transporter [[Limnothrix rosea] IAM M-220]OKH15921.1 AI-2E family transporter [[Limnothrix rosea] IAM M-220]